MTLPDRATPDRSAMAGLLRTLDDPVHLESPPGFHYTREQRRFRSLIADLERRFACTCEVEAGLQVQDASFLGQLVIPAAATAEDVPIFVRVSNFGGLALLGVEGPGRYDDAETLTFIAERDLGMVLEALAALDYVPLLEDVLFSEDYQASDAMRAHRSHPPSWFDRYFSYL